MVFQALSCGPELGIFPGGMGSKTHNKAAKGEPMRDEAFEKGTEGPAGLQDGMEQCGGGGCVTVWD